MADSPVLYVYYRPDNDDSYPGVPNRHITEADWASFTIAQRRTVENATTQEGYTRRKVWLHRDLVDETEQQRAEREAREQAERDSFIHAQRVVKGYEFDALARDIVDDPLDIWDGFDRTSPKAWDDSTFDGMMAGVDALFAQDIANGTVVKTDLGASTDPDKHVYSYEAGNPQGATVILNAGMHLEWVGLRSALRFFESFVRSNHPLMRQFRQRFRVIYVPMLSPTAYQHGNIVSPGGANINRNADFWWNEYTTAPISWKGTAPFSTPEAAILRDLILTRKPSLFFDCHNMGGTSGGDRFEYLAPGNFTVGGRQFTLAAMDKWRAVYNADGAMAVGEYSGVAANAPTMLNWASYAMRWLNGDPRSAGALFETSADLFGSTDAHTTRAAIRAYAGAITTIMAEWLKPGAAQHPAPYAISVGATRRNLAPTVSVTAGGTFLDTIDPFFFTWGAVLPTNISLDHLFVPLPYAPALLTVRANGTIQTSPDSVETAGSFRVSLWRDGVKEVSSEREYTIPAAQGVYIPFETEATIRVNDVSTGKANKLQLQIDVVSGGGRKLQVQRCNIVANVTPNTDDAPILPAG